MSRKRRNRRTGICRLRQKCFEINCVFSSEEELIDEDMDVTNEDLIEDNTKDNKRRVGRKRTGRSGPQRLTRSMTKHSPQESKTEDNIESKVAEEDSDISEDNENQELNTGVTAGDVRNAAKTVNGKRRRKKRGLSSISVIFLKIHNFLIKNQIFFN